MKDLYVVNCCRTAIGSFGGSLKNTPAADMGAVVVKAALKRANVKAVDLRAGAAMVIAAHEAGHAMQKLENYAPLNLRSAIVPAVNISSSLSTPMFILG